MRFRESCTLICLLVLGCNDTSEPTRVPVFSASLSAQWSGGTLTVVSSEPLSSGQTPTFFADTIPVAFQQVNSTTFSLSLPPGSSGSRQLYVAVDGVRNLIGAIEVHGLTTRAEAGELAGQLYPVRDQFNQWLFLGYSPGGLTMVNPALLTSSTVPGLFFPGGAHYGFGPTSDPNRWIVKDTGSTLTEWELFPVTKLIDTIPHPGPANFRQVARLSDSIWLFTSSHYAWTDTAASLFPYILETPAESPWSIHISPRLDRAVVTSNAFSQMPGVPVLDALTGDTAFTVHLPTQGLNPAEYAVFDASGDHLTIIGGDNLTPRMLARVDATTGDILSLDSLPAGSAGLALAMDGAGKYLFAFAMRGDFPIVYVRDAATLELLGTMAIPEVAENTCATIPIGCGDAAMAVDDAAHALYLVIPGTATRVYTFDILP
jgi:hypothetical protein